MANEMAPLFLFLEARGGRGLRVLQFVGGGVWVGGWVATYETHEFLGVWVAAAWGHIMILAS